MENNYSFSLERIQDHIDSSVNTSPNLSTTEKGDNFTKWILTYFFERTEDEINKAIQISGKGDHSVDAWFEDNNGLNIVQAKYNSHKWSELCAFKEYCFSMVNGTTNYENANPFVRELLDVIYGHQEKIDLYYITNQKFTSTDKDNILSLGTNYTINNINVEIHVFDILGILDFFERSLENIPKRFLNRHEYLVVEKSFETMETCVAEVALKHLAEFIDRTHDYIFFSNIRQYKGKTEINKAIAETFQTKPKPNFWLYNNGITIVCDEFESNKINSHTVEIVTPQIVNGCQTGTIIYNEYKKLSPLDKTNLQGSILVKIIQDKNVKYKDQITEYTNKQNSVSGKDFFALQKFQKKLKVEFEKIGFYYEIQAKASLAHPVNKYKYKGDSRLSYLFPYNFENILLAKEVVQAYAAGMHFLPGTAWANSGRLTPGGGLYEKLFNENTPEDPYYFLLPYAVMKYAKYELNFNKKDKNEYKRIGVMFFTATYFRTLYSILLFLNRIDKIDNYNPLKIDIEKIKKIFFNQLLNKNIFILVESIIKQFVNDSKTIEIIKEKYDGVNYSNFFKNHVEDNIEVLKVLDYKIDSAIKQDFSQDDLAMINKIWIDDII